ncbi:Putative thiamine biosynthesis protein HI_0357 [Urinicoccus massiliensis]|uniref:Thiamine biosynthesis protein HI_0357 n=1 Tax=Urinicoccus massiliensis TaxID=1723382 RepID=A0A8H2M8F1_9FIRM|nr:ABC transporter substrate-binding protein [Urinicoccus massiliensis]VFB17032.1 Putative thiamine biosynthesis protein HI_0357 [Urinicoccus massiliensis]
MNFKKLTALALAACFLLTACGSKSQEKNAGAKSDQKNLKEVQFVLDWTPNTNHTGVYVADALGYYAEEGLKLNIVQPPEDGAEALVASGKADFGVSFQDVLAATFSNDNPLPITAICAIINHNTSGILSAKDKNITRPKDMEGHNYATWDNPIEQAIIKNVIQKDGGNPNKVEFIPSTATDAVSAIQSKIDTVWVYYAWDGLAAQVKNVPHNYFSFIDINPVFDYYSPVIISNNQLLKEDPETVKAFLRATVKGYQYAMENPEKAAEILCKANPELDKDLVLASQKWLADQYQADSKQFGYIDQTRWDRFYQWLADENLIKKPLDKGYGFTNDFLPQ